jgi:glycosyltransferase involved in cell wall biosynthesis
MSLAGLICVRNGNELDYCWKEAIESMLPICDEVVVCDGQSTDDTQDMIRDWMKRESKIKLCVYDWPNPIGDIEFWVNWLNYARGHVSCDFYIQLDADEVLHEKSYDDVKGFLKLGRASARCIRWNFWKDARHLIPSGECLARDVCRIAPKNVWLPSDGQHPKGAEMVTMSRQTKIEIFHYGFLRKRDAYFQKSKSLHRMFFNTYDPRLTQAELAGGNWMERIEGVEWSNRLDAFTGSHPVVMASWLKERNYEI